MNKIYKFVCYNCKLLFKSQKIHIGSINPIITADCPRCLKPCKTTERLFKSELRNKEGSLEGNAPLKPALEKPDDISIAISDYLSTADKQKADLFLRSLTPIQRKISDLVFTERLSNVEASVRLGVSENWVARCLRDTYRKAGKLMLPLPNRHVWAKQRKKGISNKAWNNQIERAGEIQNVR